LTKQNKLLSSSNIYHPTIFFTILKTHSVQMMGGVDAYQNKAMIPTQTNTADERWFCHQ